MAKLLSLVRIACLFTVLLFSIIVIGLSAHFTWTTTEYLGGYFNFSALSIAVATLSILSIPPIVFIDFARKGAFSSTIAFEVGWLGILSVLFLASGALTAQFFQFNFPSGCNLRFDDLQLLCQESAAVLAFDFLSWIILMGYTIVLMIISFKAGGTPWKISVADFANNASPTPGPTSVGASGPIYPMAQPGMPMAEPQPGYGTPISQAYSSTYGTPASQPGSGYSPQPKAVV